MLIFVGSLLFLGSSLLLYSWLLLIFQTLHIPVFYHARRRSLTFSPTLLSFGSVLPAQPLTANYARYGITEGVLLTCSTLEDVAYRTLAYRSDDRANPLGVARISCSDPRVVIVDDLRTKSKLFSTAGAKADGLEVRQCD